MKLYFKYGAMNSGKTLEIIRTAYNFEENGFKLLLVKPGIDKKGNEEIVSRTGFSRKVDLILESDDLVSNYDLSLYDVILVDEAQFLTEKQVEDLWVLTKNNIAKVFCYGLKSDFQTKCFPGSKRLFELADKIEEITTLCSCGEKAMFNLRKVDGISSFSGDQVAIDGFSNVTYDPVCGTCYIRIYNEVLKEKDNKTKLVRQKKI